MFETGDTRILFVISSFMSVGRSLELYRRLKQRNKVCVTYFECSAY